MKCHGDQVGFRSWGAIFVNVGVSWVIGHRHDRSLQDDSQKILSRFFLLISVALRVLQFVCSMSWKGIIQFPCWFEDFIGSKIGLV